VRIGGREDGHAGNGAEGGEVFERSFKALARAGRIVTCGSTSAAEATIPMRAVFFKSLSILGSTMGSLADLHALLPYFADRRLRPVVARVLPFEEAPAAQELLARREVFGKIVLDLG
jgi:NADPH:quinone reductase-like Zn-dependent oxidoreductase